MQPGSISVQWSGQGDRRTRSEIGRSSLTVVAVVVVVVVVVVIVVARGVKRGAGGVSLCICVNGSREQQPKLC